MTALAAAGTVDCSGLVAGILQRFRAVGVRISTEVAGNPGTVRAASQQHAQQAQQLSKTSQGARQRSSALAANWEGGAYDAYAAKTGRICEQLDQAATTLAEQAQKLDMAAAALEGATQRMTALLQDFDAKANRLIAEAHTSAPGSVNLFVQVANRLGQSLVTESEKVRDDLSAALDLLAGKDPGKPDGDATISVKRDEQLRSWLGKQPWFEKWYAEHGATDDPTHPKFGKLDTELGSSEVDKRLPRIEPTSPLGKAFDKTSGTLWKSGDKTLWELTPGLEGERGFDVLGGRVGVSGELHGPRVTYDGKVGWEDSQLTIDGHARASVIDAKTAAYATVGPATLKGSAEGFVGADANLSVKAGLHGGAVDVGGFAGAEAKAQLAGDVGGIGAGVTASARAGVGADFHARATWEDWHFKADYQAGAALGVGGSIGGTIDIDVPKMWSTFEHYDPVAAQTLRDGAAWVGNTASEASHAIGDAIERLGR